MEIRTWNTRFFDSAFIDQQADLGDVYFEIIRAWATGIGYHWKLEIEKSKRILKSKFDSDLKFEAKYHYLDILRFELKSKIEHEFLKIVNIDEQKRILEQLIAEDFAPGVFQAGLFYEFGQKHLLKSNLNLAVKYYRQAAKLGHVPAMKRVQSFFLKKYHLHWFPVKNICRIPFFLKTLLISSHDLGDYRVNF